VFFFTKKNINLFTFIGRLDQLIPILPPTFSERIDILQSKIRNIQLSSTNIDFELVAKLTKGFTGADLKECVRRVGLHAIQQEKQSIETTDFAYVIKQWQIEY
jgi:ATP-dependent 26S proteasome regulatory subunit